MSGPVDIDLELIEPLEAFIARRNETSLMTHTDAVNVIVRDWLMAQGFMPLPGDKDAVTDAFTAASVPTVPSRS